MVEEFFCQKYLLQRRKAFTFQIRIDSGNIMAATITEKKFWDRKRIKRTL